MMHEIIYTEHYALIASDGEIKEGDWFINTVQNELYCHNIERYDVDKDYLKKVIGHRPLTDAPILEGVPLLPKFGKGKDVEDLALAYASSKGYVNSEGYSDKQVGLLHGFIDGYNKAKETYNLTLTKLLDLYVEETGYGMDMWGKEENNTMSVIAEIIQSLQQPKRPKYFKCETEVECAGNNNNGCFLESPGHDCGCVWVYPTIINLQGQKELKGEYIYG